jgi:hypothetical protein
MNYNRIKKDSKILMLTYENYNIIITNLIHIEPNSSSKPWFKRENCPNLYKPSQQVHDFLCGTPSWVHEAQLAHENR